MEIERKFIVKYLPKDLPAYPSSYIEQYYISFQPEIRLRRMNKEYFLTIKTGSGLARNEFEFTVSKDTYIRSINLKISNVICKNRYKYNLPDGLIAEVDIYTKNLSCLHIVEVEFPDLESSKRFLPPEWFGKEVTNDSEYKNQSLSQVDIRSEE